MTDHADPNAHMRGQIETLLDSGVAALVEEYFDPAGPFAADTYDTLGDNDPFRIGPDDVAAAGLLDVSPSPALVRALIADADAVTGMLEAVDPAVSLWDASDDLLDSARTLWAWLRNHDGVGPVIAGKLLARKRPRLIPIYDQVVESILAPPPGRFWATLREVLQDEPLRARVEALPPATPTVRITALRRLDVAVWMAGSGSRNAENARRRCDWTSPFATASE